MLWTKAGWQRANPITGAGAGALRIDTANKNATVGGQLVELSPLLWRLLRLLAERPGRLVTRAELKRALWPYAERIDTERRLNTAVRALRAALGDCAESPRYIQTERSYGYRWLAPEPRKRRPAASAALGLACLAIIVSAAWSRQPMPRSDPAAVMRAQSAVEEWRAAPTAAALVRAERRVGQASSRAPATATLLVLQAELALGGRWNWRSADRAYRAALKLEPANSDARLGLAWLDVNRGERPAAMRLAGQLLSDTVVTGERRTDLGWLLIRTERPDLAAIACGANAGASINRQSCAHSAYAALGRYDEARSAAILLMAQLHARPRTIRQIRGLSAAAGYAQFLDWRVANFLPAQASSFQRAQVLADAGHHQAALDSLARAVAAHEPLAIKLASTPSFASLNRQPRFRVLVRAVGLPADRRA